MTAPRNFGLAAIGMTAALIAMVGAGNLAAAAPSPASVIAARQANYKKMGAAMKVLKDQLGSGTIDKVKAVAAAKTLASTGRQQAGLFPNGSGPSSGAKTAALPAIWTKRTVFDAEMRNLVAQSDKLVAASATGNAAAIGAQFKAVGASCASCHKQFRAQD